MLYGLDGFLLGMVVFMGTRLWDFYRKDFSRTNFVYFLLMVPSLFFVWFTVFVAQFGNEHLAKGALGQRK